MGRSERDFKGSRAGWQRLGDHFSVAVGALGTEAADESRVFQPACSSVGHRCNGISHQRIPHPDAACQPGGTSWILSGGDSCSARLLRASAQHPPHYHQPQHKGEMLTLTSSLTGAGDQRLIKTGLSKTVTENLNISSQVGDSSFHILLLMSLLASSAITEHCKCTGEERLQFFTSCPQNVSPRF